MEIMTTNYKLQSKQLSLKPLVIMLCLVFSAGLKAQIIEDGTYQIYNNVHGEVITTETSDDFDAFMTAPDETDDFQLWSFTHQEDDIYIIENLGSSNTLGINDGWCGVFGDVKANFSSTDANVAFKITEAETEGTYVFEIGFTECNFGSVNDPVKAFDIQDGASGAEIQTFDVDITNPNQQFQIVVPGTLSNNSFAKPEFTSFFNSNTKKFSVNSNEIINQIELFNLSGKLVKTIKDINSQNASIDLSTVSNGLYIVRYSIQDKLYSSKTLVY